MKSTTWLSIRPDSDSFMDWVCHAECHKCHHDPQHDVLFGFDHVNQHDDTQNNNT
jgi:hypothetical protein